jgi:diguanylate cyclase (GGDEF)-like protein
MIRRRVPLGLVIIAAAAAAMTGDWLLMAAATAGLTAVIALTRISPRAVVLDCIALVASFVAFGAWMNQFGPRTILWVAGAFAFLGAVISAFGSLGRSTPGRVGAFAMFILATACVSTYSVSHILAAIALACWALTLVRGVESKRFSVDSALIAASMSAGIISLTALVSLLLWDPDPLLCVIAGLGLALGLGLTVRRVPLLRHSLRADVLRSDLETSVLPEVEITIEGDIEFANATMKEWWGSEIPTSLLSALNVANWEEFEFAMRRARDSGRDSTLNLLMHVDSTETRNVTATVTALNDPEFEAFHVSFVDQTEHYQRGAQQERQIEALRERAETDALTGLANRVGVMAALEQRLLTDSVTLLFLDLDGFKAINDTHGHALGDEVLKVVAMRLHHLVRTYDVVARLGGDEFVILGEYGAWTPGRIQQLVEVVSGPMEFGVVRVSVGVSVGEALGGRGEDPAVVMERADAAMYATKRSRKAALPADQASLPPSPVQPAPSGRSRVPRRSDLLR